MLANHYFGSSALLCVDDDAIVRLYLSKLLESEYLQIIEAENGKTALDVLQENNNIQYIVLDLDMPMMNGYEFLDYVNKIENKWNWNIFVHSTESESYFFNQLTSRGISPGIIYGYYKKNIDTRLMVYSILNKLNRSLLEKVA